MENESYPQNNNYGKKSWWKLLLMYLIIGGAVYGLIYYFVLSEKGGYNSGGQNYQQNYAPTQTSPSPGTQTPASTPTPAEIQTPASASVTISNFSFSPASITVHKGTKVTWTNNDSVPHTVTGDNGGPSSPTLSNGNSYSYVFTTVGTFPYHCSIHPMMKGTIRVTE